MRMDAPRFATAILAAGASSRMGRPKMLLPWGSTTVLGHLVAQWQKIGATQVTVVCAVDDKPIEDELDRIGVRHEFRILNPDPVRGMFSSIQCAAGWTGWNSSLTHWAIALGDQPHLSETTLRALVQYGGQHSAKICQPAHNGRPRHPIFFPKHAWRALVNSRHVNLKEFLASHVAGLQLMEMNDPGLDLDLDTPSDYEHARRQFGG